MSDVLLATGAVLAWLSVLIDTARGSPPDGATRTFGRASNVVLGVLTRPFRRRWWRDVHVEVDLPSTRAALDDPDLTLRERALLLELLLEPCDRTRAHARRARAGAQPDARWSSSVPYCTHRYPAAVSNLCMRYGCPDDPSWAGDRR